MALCKNCWTHIGTFNDYKGYCSYCSPDLKNKRIVELKEEIKRLEQKLKAVAY